MFSKKSKQKPRPGKPIGKLLYVLFRGSICLAKGDHFALAEGDHFALAEGGHFGVFYPLKTGNKCIMPEPNMYITPGTPSCDFGIVALHRLIEFSKIDKKNATKMFMQHMLKQLKMVKSK